MLSSSQGRNKIYLIVINSIDAATLDIIYSWLVFTRPRVASDQVISEQEGKTVIVPCPVNREKCGELHSLNWFKGDNRIAAMLLDDSNVTSVAAEFEDRISDEDIYLCDTTYFIPIETCDNFNGHRVELNVLGFYMI
ncbi:hypothetical protein GQX74_012787 [Glossina fuscipes]|nr:hypothetical protein GQX74_012787 [Glossina fuscipes]